MIITTSNINDFVFENDHLSAEFENLIDKKTLTNISSELFSKIDLSTLTIDGYSIIDWMNTNAQEGIEKEILEAILQKQPQFDESFRIDFKIVKEAIGKYFDKI